MSTERETVKDPMKSRENVPGWGVVVWIIWVGVGHAGVGWGLSCRGGWGGSCKGRVGDTGVGWGLSCRGGVGDAGVG